MEVIIENGRLRVIIDTLGAEIKSVFDKKRGCERIWDGNPKWWKRHTPVLFPIVGALWHGVMRHEGMEYRMGQHGFARDMEFELVKRSAGNVVFKLNATDETLKMYPFKFELLVSHEISDNGILTTDWRVINNGNKMMYFQIGGHPAYMLPAQIDGRGARIVFDGGERPYKTTMIESEGCVSGGERLFGGDSICIGPDTFAADALIFENPCPQRVTLYDASGVKYLEFVSECPALGIWAPCKAELAPFVCLEPWWGRTDRVGYTGDIAHREYMQHLAAGNSTQGRWSVAFF